MATTWPTALSGDVLSGDGAKTFGLDLAQRDLCVMEQGWDWRFTTATTTSASYVAAETKRWLLPPWANTDHKIYVALTIGNDAGGTTSCRLSDGTTNGTAQTTTATAANVVLELAPASDWGDTVKSLEIQLQASSGTASVGPTYVANMWVSE